MHRDRKKAQADPVYEVSVYTYIYIYQREAGVFSIFVKDPSCAAGEKEGRGAVKLATGTQIDKIPKTLLSMLCRAVNDKSLDYKYTHYIC